MVTALRYVQFIVGVLPSSVGCSPSLRRYPSPKSAPNRGPFARGVTSHPTVHLMREAILDANILLRYLTDDPRELADRAVAILEQAEDQSAALIVAPLTLAEVIYVLESVYRWPRTDVAERLLRLISESSLIVIEEATIVQSLAWYRDRSGLDFADAYIAALAVERGHSTVISFDRDLNRLPGITVVQGPISSDRD